MDLDSLTRAAVGWSGSGRVDAMHPGSSLSVYHKTPFEHNGALFSDKKKHSKMMQMNLHQMATVVLIYSKAV